MTHEIKFRAWDTKKKKWLHDFRLHPNGTVMITEKAKGGLWQYETSTRKAQNVILTQFTGLKDKNGVEIYDGDIVEYEMKNNLATVTWLNSGHWLIFKQNKCPIDDSDGHRFEIKGNIYENPELLK